MNKKQARKLALSMLGRNSNWYGYWWFYEWVCAMMNREITDRENEKVTKELESITAMLRRKVQMLHGRYE